MLAFLPLESAYRRLTHCFQPMSSLPTYPPSKLGHAGDFAGDSLTISPWFSWPVASMCKCPLKGFLPYWGWTSPSIPPQVQGAQVLQSPVLTAIQALGCQSANSSPKAGPCPPAHQLSHTLQAHVTDITRHLRPAPGKDRALETNLTNMTLPGSY